MGDSLFPRVRGDKGGRSAPLAPAQSTHAASLEAADANIQEFCSFLVPSFQFGNNQQLPAKCS